jgi:hypothetical protein
MLNRNLVQPLESRLKIHDIKPLLRGSVPIPAGSHLHSLDAAMRSGSAAVSLSSRRRVIPVA